MCVCGSQHPLLCVVVVVSGKVAVGKDLLDRLKQLRPGQSAISAPRRLGERVLFPRAAFCKVLPLLICHGVSVFVRVCSSVRQMPRSVSSDCGRTKQGEMGTVCFSLLVTS